MTDFEKAKKNLKNDMITLFILELVAFGLLYFVKDTFHAFSLGFAVFLFIGFILAKNGFKAAGIFGIVVGILMMLTIITGDIIDFLLGLFVVIHSYKYNKLLG